MTLLASEAEDATEGEQEPAPPVALESVVSPAPRSTWSRLVAEDPSSMADHSPEWVDAMTRSGPYRDASRLYELSDGRQFVLPLVRRGGAGRPLGVAASMPDGWGFGGVIGPGKDATAIRLVLDDLGRHRGSQTRIRPDPLEADLWAHGAPAGIVTTPKRAHVLDLTVGLEALRAGMHPSAQRALRKAERSDLEVVADSTGRLLETYYGLYERSLARWAASSNEPLWLARWRGRHRDPLEKLQAMADCLGDRFRLYLAFVDGKPAAGQIVLFGNAAHDTRGAMDREVANPVRATFLVQWKVIEDTVAAGCKVLHLGESGTSAGLCRQKENYGAVAVPYRDYRVERLPVTRADQAVRSAAKAVLRFRES